MTIKRAKYVMFPLMLVFACSISEKSLDQAQTIIDDLESKGVPSEVLSKPKVFVYQARESRRLGNVRQANLAYDSLKFHINKAQKMYNEQISNLGPTIEETKAAVLKAAENLSGRQAAKVDSVLAVVDSLVNINWLLQANNVTEELKNALPQLKEDEKRAVELRRRIPGEWQSTQTTTSPQFKEVNAREDKIFTFFRDGRVRLVERKRGQSGPYLKENWEFLSTGKYDIMGDTILLLIDRFAAVRQDFETLHIIDEKPVWKKEPHPTYDSTITDGSQNRFIVYEDLSEDFRQTRKF